MIKLGISAFILFIVLSLLRELIVSPMLIEIGLTTFYAQQISYIIFAVLVLIAHKKMMIENNFNIKKLFFFSNIPVKNVFIALTISFLSVPVAFGFNAIEVLFVAQFSPEAAANLWDFKAQEVVIEKNYKLGGSIGVFLLFVLVHSLIGPLIEEVTFRGSLLSESKNKYTLQCAILISSVLFTIIHPSKQYLELFLFSLFVAFLTIKTGCIVYAYIIHAGYNLFSWLMEGHNIMLFFKNKPIDSLHKLPLWKGELILMVTSLMLVVFLLPTLFKNIDKQGKVHI